MRENPCFTKMTTFYSEVTGSVDESEPRMLFTSISVTVLTLSPTTSFQAG